MEVSENQLEIALKIREYGTWARNSDYPDSPGFDYEGKHKEMRECLILYPTLSNEVKDKLKVDVSSIIQTLHMSRRDYRAALGEIYRNDPEGKRIIDNSLDAMASFFQEEGFGVLKRDFLSKDLS